MNMKRKLLDVGWHREINTESVKIEHGTPGYRQSLFFPFTISSLCQIEEVPEGNLNRFLLLIIIDSSYPEAQFHCGTLRNRASLYKLNPMA